MKQTNNAIKFLMAQYRAIFKNANLKMFLAAATAAAAMASAQAQAAGSTIATEDELKGAFKDNLVTITGTAGDSGNGVFEHIQLELNTQTSALDLADKTIKLTDDKNAYTTNFISVSGSGSAKKSATINNVNIDISVEQKDKALPGFLLKATGSGDLTVNANNVNVQTNLMLATSGAESSVKLTADSITIGDDHFIASGDETRRYGRAILYVGTIDPVNGGSTAFGGGTVVLGDADTIINIKEDGKIRTASLSGSAADAGTHINASQINVNGGILSFAKGDTDGKTFFNAARTEINGGYFSVQNGAGLTLDLAKNGTLNFNGEAVFDIADNVVVKNGTVSIGEKTVLAGANGAAANTAVLTLGDATTGGDATLKISSGALKSFLTAEDLQYRVPTKKGTDLKDASSGSLVIASGGTLHLTDEANVELAGDKGFTFAADSGDGQIGVSAGSSLFAKNVSVSEAITATGLTVKATNLTLGKADAALSTALGVDGFEAENVTFKNKTTDFNLLEDLTLETEGKGSITGGLIIGKTGAGASLTIAGGDYTLEAQKNLEVASGSLVLNNGSSLVLTGNLKNAADGKIQLNGASKLDASGVKDLTLVASGAAATVEVKSGSTLVLDQTDVFKKGTAADTIELVTGDSSVAKGAISLDKSSVLEFKLSNEMSSLNKKQIGNIKTALGAAGITGVLSFGDNFTMSGVSGDVSMTDVMENADVYGGHGVTTGKDALVNKDVFAGNIKINTEATGDKATIESNKSVTLYNAGGAGFVCKDGQAADVSLKDGSSITLAGVGSIGAIDGEGVNSGSVTIGHSKKANTAVTAESIGSSKAVASLDIADNASLTLTKDGAKLQAQKLNVGEGASLNAAKQDIIVSTTDSGAAAGSNFFGDVTANKLSLTAGTTGNTDFIIAGDAVVDVKELVLGNDKATLKVGLDGDDTSSGTLEVENLKLAGGALIVDPEFSKDAAIAAVKNLSATDSGSAAGAQVLDGKIAVGKNAAVGVGFSTPDEVVDLLSGYGYMKDGKFVETSDLHGALVLNAPITLENSKGGVTLNTSNPNLASADVTANEFNLGAKSALVITDKAYKTDSDGVKQGTAVTLENGGAGAVKSNGGKVILAGDFDASDSNISIFSGTAATGLISGGAIDLESANGLITAKIDADGKITNWVFDKDNKLGTYFLSASAPVQDLLRKKMKGEIKGNELGVKFLGEVANSTDHSGVLADAAAHAATYAGAQQAAVAAVTTMAEAVGGRVGSLGAEATTIAATGSQANGGVWVAPMYKSVDADGFNAEGASYGADVDLAGVSFGADTVNGNMRFGAVFNIGSGDADGKGNGDGLKDEFDYYGFGIYSAMGFGNFALVGDASLNVISHDVEGHGLRGEADTTAVTMGVTGQYTISNPAVDVTPHLGARFIRLDTDSYDLVEARGVLANTDFDVQNVFSVPLGVTLSKAFEMGGWALAPSADFSITFNAGDTEAKSTTTFTGVQPIGLSTEVLDEVTYGINLGLGAQYGSFGTNIGINYTGSENTDSFGVNAQARYMF